MLDVVRKMKGGVAMVRIVKDANRLDQVFRLSESLSDPENLAQIVARFALTAEGREGLAHRLRLGDMDLEQFRSFPQGTLARAFAEHMLERKLDPTAIPTLHADSDRDWVLAHLYETHDLWHVVTGFDTDVAGELGLQAFYAAQIGSPLPFAILAAGMLNTALYCREDGDRRMDAVVSGWIRGRDAHSLLGVRWELLWRTPLQQVRERYGLRPHRLSPSPEPIA